ncbi:hypothetical protein F5Y03DRAFT_408214 [Xylaria venustula]|nr:hypothetical protein F5Y03DRAFT_408214 [Xylaria venustula]
MNLSFDGHGLSREQLQAKAEAAALTGQLDGDSSRRQPAPPRPQRPPDACDWRADAPEPELDDLAEACRKNQQPSLQAEVCDWHGDEPERQEDDLAELCQSVKKTQQSGQGDIPAEQADAIQMPVPRLPQVAEVPEILLPSTDDESPGQKNDAKPPVETPVGEKKQIRNGKRPKKQPSPESPAGPSSAPPTGKPAKKLVPDHAGEDESSTGDKTHSPWVESLEQMPANVIEKVNLGIKQTLEAATRVLTPSAREESQSPGPSTGERTRRSTGLAPTSIAPPPSDMYMPSPTRPSTEQPREEDVLVISKKQEREQKKAERKARHEAKRKARRERNQERKDKRRQAKERNRKEKAWKKASKKGGDLPSHILQGLRIAPDAKVPYNPNCDICTRSAVSIMSSKKRNPKCTTCAKAAERESTYKYLKSSNINLGNLPSLEELIDLLRNLLRENSATTAGESEAGAQAGDQGRSKEDLAQHMSSHVRDFLTNGGEASLRGHKCNANGQPGHLARHGLDGNRDSPISTDGGQMPSDSSQISDTSTRPATPPEVDWWVQAMSKESPPSPYRSISPHVAVTPPR